MYMYINTTFYGTSTMPLVLSTDLTVIIAYHTALANDIGHWALDGHWALGIHWIGLDRGVCWTWDQGERALDCYP